MSQDIIKLILDIPEETQNIEFKRLEGPKVVEKVLKTVVAMANTDGGWIILGVDDPEKTTKKGKSRIYGIEENQELYDEILRKVQNILPPLTVESPSCYFDNDTKKTVAVIKIEKSTTQFHTTSQGEVYQRLHKGNKRLNPQEIIKFSYAKGFEKADKELVDVDFELLETAMYQDRRKQRNLSDTIQNNLYKTGLARKRDGILLPTRSAVLLFAEYPTNLMETKCAVRVYKYQGTIEVFNKTPNLVGVPKTIEGPLIQVIKKSHEYVLNLLSQGVEFHSGFTTKYQIPERAITEAITNAVIHRDYHIKRDIEIKIFEDRVEIFSPGLFVGNITKQNIGYVRADEYRNDLLVKHLREFPNPPNLDRNEGVEAMRNQMSLHRMYPPIFITYPTHRDSVEVVLLNEHTPDEWEKVKSYLLENKYIDSKTARKITNITQRDTMSRLFSKRVKSELLIKIGDKRWTKYKLANPTNTLF